MKKAATPIIRQEEFEEPNIPDAIPIDGRLRFNAVQVHKYESQAPNNRGSAPNTSVPNLDQVNQPPVPPNKQEVVET